MTNNNTTIPVRVDNLNDMITKYPVLPSVLNSGYFRKYHLQDALLITSAEVDVIIATLMADGIVKATPFGYKMLQRTKNEIIAKGVKI